MDDLRTGIRFPVRRDILLFSTAISTFPQSPIPGATHSRVKWPKRKAYHLTASTAVLKSAWRYTSTTHTSYDIRRENITCYVSYIDTINFITR